MLVLLAFSVALVCLIHWYVNIRSRMHHWSKLPGEQRNLWGQLERIFFKVPTRRNKVDAEVHLLRRVLERNAKLQEEGMNVMWVGLTPFLQVFSPELAQKVLTGSASLYRSFDYSFLPEWVGFGLFVSTAATWRQRRSLLEPSFKSITLPECVATFNEQSHFLISNIKQGLGEAVDMTLIGYQFAMDNVCETLLGVTVGAQRGQCTDYRVSTTRVEQIVRQRIVSPWLHPDVIFRYSKLGREFRRHVEVINNFTNNLIKQRMAAFGSKNKGKGWLLDSLIEMHLNGGPITLYDIHTEFKTFLFAAQDTTALGIVFTVYCLGLYPEVQKMAHDEVDALFQGDETKPITVDDCKNMKYIERVIKESLRLYPPAGTVGRKPAKDIVHNGLVIPRGADVYLNLLSLHMRTDTFPDPKKFDPDRFLPDNAAKRHPYAYIPFLAGPRNCIGHKFGMFQMKVAVANILRRFQIESVDPPEQVPIKLEITMKSQDPVRIKFKPRTTSQDGCPDNTN